MPIFRYREDRIPILIIFALFLADVAVYALVHNPVVVTAWMLFGLISKTHICAWNHHHQHVSTFNNGWLNRGLDLMYGLQTGITGHTWVLHHSIGHHQNYLDQTRDESAWQAGDGKVKSELAYTVEVGLTAYSRAWKAGEKYPALRKVFLQIGLLTLLVLLSLIAFSPFNGVMLFLVPMVLCLFFTSWATYSHHSGKSTESPFVASNNIIHRGYNLLTGNLGYHTAHHYRPGVHWSKLREVHAEIAHKIPEDCYLSPGLPWRFGQVVERPVEAPLRPVDVAPAGS